MIIFPLLIVSSIFLLGGISAHLGQSLLSYYDFVAFAIVIGGTTLVGLTLLPWEYGKEVLHVLKILVTKEKTYHQAVIQGAFQVYNKSEYSPQEGLLFERILKDGQEYLQLGFTSEKTKDILESQIIHTIKRQKKVANVVRSLGKYPPAFGLIGTVLGLVNIMKQLEQTANASSLGAEMSIALFATMYGLLVANFVVAPMGEFLIKKIDEHEDYAYTALEAIYLTSQQVGSLEFREQMGTLVPGSQNENSFEMDMSA